MRLLDSRSAEERFTELLDLSDGFLRKAGIDTAAYRVLAKRESVARAATVLLEEADRKNAMLPPGYWQSLHRLREEAGPTADDPKA